MIPLSRPWFGPEEDAAVREVLASGWVAQGPTTTRFEEEFAAYVGVKHAVAVSSCTTGLHLAVIAAEAGPGDEVILPSFTFPATANAVIYTGATPVLVDVERATLNIDVDQVEAAITPNTRAVIGVHLFGYPCDAVRLRKLCDARGILFIEDAACAAGTKICDWQAGRFGHLACFSFHARKVMTCGEGGMLTTDSDDIADLMRSLRTHGADRPADRREGEGLSPPPPHHVRLGYNYRLSDVQSAIARVQLRRLEEFIAERTERARRYDEGLGDIPALRLPPRGEELRHSYQSYVVVVEPEAAVDAREVMDRLARAGVSTRIGTFAVHREPYYRDRPVGGPLPGSEEAATASIALPLYNGMEDGAQEAVIRALRAALI